MSNARERRDAERKKLLDRADAIDKSGTVVIAPGTIMEIGKAPIGTKMRSSTGVTFRLEHVGVGSATVTVVATENPDWRVSDRTTIAPTSVLEVVV